MPYELKDRLVVGVASSAMFDLSESDNVFRDQGEEKYREYQETNKDVPLKEGISFSFIKRLLSLNDLSDLSDGPLVEVVLLSRNDPDTGIRVMNSINKGDATFLHGAIKRVASPFFIELLQDVQKSVAQINEGKDVEQSKAKQMVLSKLGG